MELDITHMINDNMARLSGSVAELGENAGSITWGNSLNYSCSNPLLKTQGEIEYARKYFKEFGAWDDSERAGWTNEEIQALVVQLIAGDIRDMEGYDTWEEYQSAAERGSVSGHIFRTEEGKYFYYLGM